MAALLLTLDPIEWLGTWATMISVIVTLVIGFSVLTSYVQFRQAQDHVAQMQKQVEKAANDFKSSGLKPPDEIVKEVQSLYDPLIDVLRARIERTQTDLRRDVDELRQLLAQSPSRDSILREVETRFRNPVDLEETILRKVLDAFLRVQNLSQPEQMAISEALAIHRTAASSGTATTTGHTGASDGNRA
jgi:hypothetical protein